MFTKFTLRAAAGALALTLAALLVIAGGPATRVPTAVAAPITAGVHQGPAVKSAQTIAKGVKWVAQKLVENAVIEFVAEGIAKIEFPGPAPQAYSEQWWAGVPRISPNQATAESLPRISKLAPSSSITRTAYVYSDPRALFSKVTSGGVRVTNNQYKVGILTVTFKPGTKSSPPSITVSDAVTSTKVIVLA